MVGLDFIRDLAVVMVIAGAAGWICRRVGLSLVVGYLVAGAIIGPFTPPFQLVKDLDRVQMLSQLGLVFLIFAIGLDLGFQRLRRLGLSVALGTFVGALFVFYACRLVGLAWGWSNMQSLFLAGMMMVSSSAIIAKVLQELEATHQRSGQLALGVTVLEDMVAVIMLTLLSTVVNVDGAASAKLTRTMGGLGAFVVGLVLVSLLFVPRLLDRLARGGAGEVRTILVAGMLLSAAWLAARAGYSLALGAFLLGVIVASTPQKPEIERLFEGLRDMFGAVFFVAIGMLVDFRLLAEAWPMVLGLTLLTLVVRPLATATGLILSGHAVRDAARAGLALTPLGEFSFIIAQTGVAAGVVPASFFPMAVGASLLTTLLSPPLIRRSAAISAGLDERMPLVLREWISFYHAWLERLGRHQQRSVLWRLTGRRFVQTGVEIAFASALVLVGSPVYRRLDQWLSEDWLFPNGLPILFWSVYGVVLLAPVVAIWRNVEALAMIFAEFATSGATRRSALRPLIETVLKAVALALLVVWLLALLPFGRSLIWISIVVLAVLALLALVFWKRLVRWHSRLEVELHTQLKTALGSAAAANLAQALRERQADWQLQAEEFVVPDLAACAGQAIGSLALREKSGCSIASIDRQGFVISNPSAEVILYPRDKLLLLGSATQIDLAARELGAVQWDRASEDIEDLSLDVVMVPSDSPRADKTLAELNPIRQVGVQIAGIQRGSQRMLSPGGGDRIQAGDELLVLGAPRQIREFREWLSPGPAGGGSTEEDTANKV